MQLAAASLNERVSFLVAVAAAVVSASILPCLLFSSSPLCSGATSLAGYAGGHFFLSIGLWIIAFLAVWLFAGRRLIRSRQNLSSKLRLLTWAAAVGLIIDGAVSLYQFVNSADVVSVLTGNTLVGLAGRGLLYILIFAAGVGLCWLIGNTRQPTETPPPRFGRN
jgi:hypothetical protein